MTKSIEIVKEHLGRTDGFITAQTLHQQILESKKKIGLTSVYRALQSMATSGEVDTYRNPTGESAFRLCTPQHHHHLVCTECGYTVEIDGGVIEQWASAKAQENGFSGISHIADIYGRCQQCG